MGVPEPREVPPELAELSDDELLARHNDGDTRAFTELVGRHRTVLWSVARRILLDHHLAEDALQVALVRAAQHSSSYRGGGALRAWLRKIVVNEAIRLLEERRRHPLPVGALIEVDVLAADARERRQVTGQASPREETSAYEAWQLIETALGSMPAPFARVFVLHVLHDLPLNAVAEREGTTDATARSRLWRARAALRKTIDIADFGNA